MQGRTLGFLLVGLLTLPMLPQIGGSQQARERPPCLDPASVDRSLIERGKTSAGFVSTPPAPDLDASPTLPQLLKQLKECREQREQAIKQEKNVAAAIRKLIAEQRKALDAAEQEIGYADEPSPTPPAPPMQPRVPLPTN